MRAHVLQHVAFEDLGQIQDWLAEKSAEVTFTRFFEDPGLPEIGGIDLVIALGGPMSVNDEDRLPWLVAEKAFIAQAIASGKAVLGICLGAQLMANSRGAAVYAGPQKEIGWFDVWATSSTSDTFRFPEQIEVLHWHGETFDLPADAKILAASEAYPHQAFQMGERAIGLQFHLEMTPESVRRIVTGCREELVPAPFVQTEQELVQRAVLGCGSTRPLLFAVLDYLMRP